MCLRVPTKRESLEGTDREGNTVGELLGVGVGTGTARGPVLRMPDPVPVPADTPSMLTPEAERIRVDASIAAVTSDLEARATAAGGLAGDILEAQAMIVGDPTLTDAVQTRLDRGATAERGVHDAFAEFRDMLTAAGGYLGERAADLEDLAGRVIAHLQGVPAPEVPHSETPFVLVAKDLAPADTAQLDLAKILALVTSEGGPTSHTAILAREKEIVAVVGVVDAASLRDGADVLVDAENGTVTIDPKADVAAEAAARNAARIAARTAPLAPGRLADGTAIPLLANLGSPKDAREAVDRGAEGVGLFRTEFLFLSSTTAPTVEEQTEAYTELLAAFPGQKVVVRVLDAGADKPLPYLTDSSEENPALGVRGIRALRAKEVILDDQLAALAAAAAATSANLQVMAPMITTVADTEYFVARARVHGLETVGVMIEVPSSAIIADRVLAECDFASIGTNDLTQYTLAADRLLGPLASLQDPWHPAVLDLIGRVGSAGAASGKPVGICGEAAADPQLAIVLVGLGATSLSMAPSALADVRAALAGVTLDDAKRKAAAALGAIDAASARAAARDA